MWPLPQSLLPPVTIWTSLVRYSCQGTSLWTCGRRSAAPPGPENVPSFQHPPSSAQSVTVDWRRLPRGFRPPTAAAQLVNRSNAAQITRVRLGLDLWGDAHVSCCRPCCASLSWQRSTKKGVEAGCKEPLEWPENSQVRREKCSRWPFCSKTLNDFLFTKKATEQEKRHFKIFLNDFFSSKKLFNKVDNQFLNRYVLADNAQQQEQH